MQVVRKLILVALAVFAVAATAQVHQARGKASVTYTGKAASADDRAKAAMAAQLKAVEFYYAEAGQSEAENFDAVREKILANPDRFILESTVLAEEDNADKKQYSVAVRVSLNVANLRNAVKANSAVAQTGRADRSPLAFVLVSRQVDSVKAFDDRVYKRVDESLKVNANAVTSEKGTEGESIRKGQISTNASTAKQASAGADRTRSVETGGSTVKRSNESTWRLIPSADVTTVFTSAFSNAGFRVKEAALVEASTGGYFKVATVENDYRSGMDLKAATMQSIVDGMRKAQVFYFALGTLDAGMAVRDPNSGLWRVAVTVNAKILDLKDAIAETLASVGPVQYAALAPTEDEARTKALQLAANSASRELTSKVTNLGLK